MNGRPDKKKGERILLPALALRGACKKKSKNRLAREKKGEKGSATFLCVPRGKNVKPTSSTV